MARYVANSREDLLYALSMLSVLSTLGALHFLAAGAVILLPHRRAAPLRPVGPRDQHTLRAPKAPGEDRPAGPAGSKASFGVQ
jgi:hypothetical protein